MTVEAPIANPEDPGEIDLARESGFTLGSLRVSPSTREVQAVGRGELVEPRVMQALVCLSRADGQVVSRDELIRCCWGGRIVGEDAINRCIAKVRHLAELTDPAPFVVDTIPRVGYRLRPTAPVTPVLGLEPTARSPNSAAEVSRSARQAVRRTWLWGLAIACVLVAFLFAGERFVSHRRPAPSMLSVAVLPIRNLTGDASLDTAADRLTEDVMGVAGRGSFFVAPRDATFAFKGKPLDPRSVGGSLRVRNVIGASLRRTATGYGLSYQIADTKTGKVVGVGEVGAAPGPDGAFPQARLALLMFGRISEVLQPLWIAEAVSRGKNERDPDYVTARIEQMGFDPRRRDIPEAEHLARIAPAAFAKNDGLEWQFDTAACFYFQGLIGAGFDRSATQRARWANTALEFGAKAARLRPYTTSPHECRAYAYASLQRRDEANAEAGYIFEIMPLSRNGYDARAVLEFDEGRFEGSLADFEEFAARVGGDPLEIGMVKLFLGDESGAITALREAAVSDPKESLAPFWLTAALERSGRHAEALTQAAAYRTVKSDDRAWRMLEASREPAFLDRSRGVREALRAAGLDKPVEDVASTAR